MKKLLYFSLGVMTTAHGMIPGLFRFRDKKLAEAYDYYYNSESDAVEAKEHTGGEYSITAKYYKPEFLTYDCSRPEQTDETTITAELIVTSKDTGESFTVELGHSVDLGHIKKPIIFMKTYDHSRIIVHSRAFNWSKKKKTGSLSREDGAAVLAAIASNLVLGDEGGARGADSHAINTGD